MAAVVYNAPSGATYPAKSLGYTTKFLTGTFDFDSSYPTGGEAFDPTGYFSTLQGVFFEPKGGYSFEYDYTAKKVKAMNFNYPGASAGPAVEVADLTNLSTITGVRWFAWGV